ncbi:MAG TPA: hypothetical protein VG318_00475 [Actinomycetota bacterium]|nr:hypothetical protein [Actinomycetota bacterium]
MRQGNWERRETICFWLLIAAAALAAALIVVLVFLVDVKWEKAALRVAGVIFVGATTGLVTLVTRRK